MPLPTPAPTPLPPHRRRVVLLGATGSIGASTLQVLRANPDSLQLVGIAALSRVDGLAAIAREFGVLDVAVANPSAAAVATSRGLFAPGTRLRSGPAGLVELASLPEADLVLVAVVGTHGLLPTLAAAAAGKDLALASKEVLVLAGAFVTAAVRRAGVRLLPVDSEHNAIFQCLDGRSTPAPGTPPTLQGNPAFSRLILTASGGPFRRHAPEELERVTPDEALRHPNWRMGPKVTIDSATMANKGLEMIEARWLFDACPSQIDVVIHPQSIVHSMVEFVDGSILAQLSPPSMTFAIQHALLHPRRAAGVQATLDFSRALTLDFEPPDPRRFPCLGLARCALEAGGTSPAVFNAANEVAVAAFMSGRLPFPGIARVVESTLTACPATEPGCLEDVLAADATARARATEALIRG